MGIYLPNMEMPKNCAECRLWDTCEYLNDFDDWISIFEAVEDGDLVRNKNCPLIEIPTPHGRLIDADTLLKKAPELQEYLAVLATVVIEAEGSKGE